MVVFKIRITRLEKENEWCIVSNPRPDRLSQACNALLMNTANEYVEYKNCGVIHRMIRLEDCHLYGICKATIKSECLLTFKNVNTGGIK